MIKNSQIQKLFSQIRVIRPPKYRLATFGASIIDYSLITDVAGFKDRARLRTGKVISEKPNIITPDNLKNRFEGFGPESEEFTEWLNSKYGRALQGLEYRFRHEPDSARIELIPPEKLLHEISKDFDGPDYYYNALLKGTDKYWEMSIMKFIIEETLTSFSANLQEFRERGFFEGEDRHDQRKHREIRFLFGKARNNHSFVPELGRKLKEYGLFEHYQDEFFRLVG